ncbi:hypothetical protein [Priestia megaterium]|uniref:hypothetical protein n=1 Tax=Priestia megaterium TaxID=1404 RepID=UPI00298CB6BD|nr:hypothetical protein [Priestia megaterium]
MVLSENATEKEVQSVNSLFAVADKGCVVEGKESLRVARFIHFNELEKRIDKICITNSKNYTPVNFK